MLITIKIMNVNMAKCSSWFLFCVGGEAEKNQSCHEFKWPVIALELLLIIMNKLRGTEIHR